METTIYAINIHMHIYYRYGSTHNSTVWRMVNIGPFDLTWFGEKQKQKTKQNKRLLQVSSTMDCRFIEHKKEEKQHEIKPANIVSDAAKIWIPWH